MKFNGVLSAVALLVICSVSSYALDTRCVATGPAASQLSYIAHESANAQTQAEEIEAYLRTNDSPDWRWLATEMSYLKENVQHLQKATDRFERTEPKLTELQSEQLKR